MAKAPWYLNQSGPGLSHQRKSEEESHGSSKFDPIYQRGMFVNQAAGFRKGACKNCGALTHKEKDCMERPRKVGAWKSGTDIKPDEVVVDSELLKSRRSDWDSKRDRDVGFDSAEHQAIALAKHAAAEKERSEILLAKLAKEKLEREQRKKDRSLNRKNSDGDDDNSSISSFSSESSDEEVGEIGKDPSDRLQKLVDKELLQDDETTLLSNENESSKTKMAMKNLRFREDTAKYLLNLDVDSAYYDPKTRSMRENPHPEKGDSVVYKGDAAWRASGESISLLKDQMFAWDASAAGTDINLQANPTQVELLKHQVEERKKALAEKKKAALAAKYGASVFENAGVEQETEPSSEVYREYDVHGRLIVKQKRDDSREREQEGEEYASSKRAKLEMDGNLK